MLFYAAQGVSCAARVRKPSTSGTSNRPKVLHLTARTASQESCVFDTKNCLVGCLAQQPEALLHQLQGSMLQRRSKPPPLYAGLVQKTRGFQAKIPGFRQPSSGSAFQIRFSTSHLLYRGVQGVVRSKQCTARGTSY